MLFQSWNAWPFEQRPDKWGSQPVNICGKSPLGKRGSECKDWGRSMAGALGNNRKIQDNCMKNGSVSSGRLHRPQGWSFLTCSISPSQAVVSQASAYHWVYSMSCASIAEETSRRISPIPLRIWMWDFIKVTGGQARLDWPCLVHVSGARKRSSMSQERKRYKRPLSLEEERRYASSWSQTFLRSAVLLVFNVYKTPMSLLVNSCILKPAWVSACFFQPNGHWLRHYSMPKRGRNAAEEGKVLGIGQVKEDLTGSS